MARAGKFNKRVEIFAPYRTIGKRNKVEYKSLGFVWMSWKPKSPRDQRSDSKIDLDYDVEAEARYGLAYKGDWKFKSPVNGEFFHMVGLPIDNHERHRMLTFKLKRSKQTGGYSG